ncbi:MAG TPA: serine/threonine-protein kinase [Polyangiaceae bacterium]|nr:serine/threonine-protein kinase [Polyangiaceae bacterium]
MHRIIGPGDVLGRYELLLPVAAGGMAMVWAARLKGSRGFHKIVAVKTMLPKLSEDAQFEKMFLDEATLASRIHHPNVVEVLDLGEQNGVLFIAMEWVDGVPLNQLMKAAKGTGIPGPVAIHIITNAAEGLHSAHELKDDEGRLVGLVHRDVSPQNILVGFDGFTKMLDFGLAKATMLGDGATRAGQLKGKISYMAPEQVRGDSLDRRADIFALGVVLYAVSTGKHPFRRESEGATLFTISSPDPAPSPSRFMEYPAELEAVLMKAISKDPDKRYSTAIEFSRALEGTLVEADRAHGGERVSAFIKTLLGTQQEAQRAALIDSIRRADRASLMPASATLEGLSASGTSGVSSVSTVGITQSLLPDQGFRLGPGRLAVGLAALALVVGGIAFFVTRKPAAPKAAAPTVSAPLTRPAAPGTQVELNPLTPLPDDSSIKVEVEPVTPTPHVPGKARPAAPASSATPAGSKKKAAWREDPGF